MVPYQVDFSGKSDQNLADFICAKAGWLDALDQLLHKNFRGSHNLFVGHRGTRLNLPAV